MQTRNLFKDGTTKVGMPKPTEFIKLIDDLNLLSKAVEIEER